ncbi:hypothetical protein ACN47A_07610 [Myxococcus fulvus]|uniref:hypothetical protein n=1 Tax=Myxococcus fulvus TaxID=33 RepID=UPI003B9BDCD7
MKSFDSRRAVLPSEGTAGRLAPVSVAPTSREAALQRMESRLNQSPRVVAQAKLSASLAGRDASAPIQRVGGPKFGLRRAEGAEGSQGLLRLSAAHAAYKEQVRNQKKAARDAFTGHEGDHEAQKVYSQALAAAELSPEGLMRALGAGFALGADGLISHGETAVASLLTGDDAYAEVEEEGLAQPVYKKRTLEGLSGKDYVRVHGAYLRRMAYRGITPPERKAYQEGEALRPLNDGHEARVQGQMGYTFETSGETKERSREPHPGDEDKERQTDLEWAQSHFNDKLKSIEDDPTLLSFLQTRKGVGKLLSARSTKKPITSNAGKEFAGFGEVEIDLARVPPEWIYHHYAEGGFDAKALAGPLGKKHVPGALSWETDRANETVLRNREVVLAGIPREAVTKLKDAPSREAYDQEFRRRYVPYYQEAYQASVEGETGFLEPAPEPEHIPSPQDHYTQLQARSDVNVARAKTEGLRDSRERIAYIQQFLMAYPYAWTEAYGDTLSVDGDWERFDYPGELPNAPTPVSVPSMSVEPDAGAAGRNQGAADGEVAAKAFLARLVDGSASVVDAGAQVDSDEDVPVSKGKSKKGKAGGSKKAQGRKGKGKK